MARSSEVTVPDEQLEKLVVYRLEKLFKKRLDMLHTFNLRESLMNLNLCLLVIDSNESASKIVEMLMRIHVSACDKTIFSNSFLDPMLGHAYGRAMKRPTKDLVYRRSSGQAFWTEITGDPDFYLKLIRLMKEEPVKHKQKYAPAWDAAVNKFTAEFVSDFCFASGQIDWEKLVRFVSADATTA